MIDHYVVLALAVVDRAMVDLRTESRNPEASKASIDAADFLMRRLWQDTIWLDLLGPHIAREPVRRRVVALLPANVRAGLKAKALRGLE